MKATGIVRRIDDLGRVVIPKEIRRTMRIRDGEPLEIYVDREGEVILKKYSPITDLGQYAKEYADSLHEAIGYIVCIADRDEIIAVSGGFKKDLLKKSIGTLLEDVIGSGQTKILDEEHSLTEDERVTFKNSVVAPIVTNGNPIGAVIITSSEEAPMGNLENKLAETAAAFLAKQMKD
ncbi:stage V sporulation protein T [Desulfallas thermosapovorans]|uniref:AbrB family transcriptional regulator (Stage V sporulation protein T) n=1 Tax=Desulfallas thermosapovorans DSM 6562 TaxID=1121431 RepID=A0A5S4ZWL7_9FIRM|nr:stage V sporulation protein T [Desulfallas thermosapovorans]TYO97346.1 AbrB family transcriptional regulator (stage V sporulation protein T) [Desulfallas thermosapovorans DSM 6562]